LGIVAGKDVIYVAVSKNDYTTFLHALDKRQLNILWSLHVEPVVGRPKVGMLGGSYDAFGQLASSYKVYMDIDSIGNIYVAIPVTGNIGGGASTITRHNLFLMKI
jgi:hypothetical protein